jgi:hypothetical protein
MFEGVQEGAAILVCKEKGEKGQLFRRHEVNNLIEVIDRLDDLSSYRAHTCSNGKNHCSSSCVDLGSIASIGLGGVTGDSRYFTMSEERRLELNLPLRAVRPIVSKARHIKRPIAGPPEFEKMCQAGERIWLFDPTPALVSESSAVRSYLRLSPDRGGCRRDSYKIRLRNPWYRTPLPRRVDAFISGMSMSGIWMCFNEVERLNATNTLYVVRFKHREAWERRFEWALALCTSAVRKQLQRICRVYADGLRKIEPGQLSRVLIPTPPLKHARRLYLDAVSVLLEGEEIECRRIADKAFKTN